MTPSSGTAIKPEYEAVTDPALGFLLAAGSGLLRSRCGLELLNTGGGDLRLGTAAPPAVAAVGVGVDDEESDDPDDEVGLRSWWEGEVDRSRLRSLYGIIPPPPFMSPGLGLALMAVCAPF